jgi:enamine deaminase RidA (YjgF/YER057c/UK114 family)
VWNDFSFFFARVYGTTRFSASQKFGGDARALLRSRMIADVLIINMIIEHEMRKQTEKREVTTNKSATTDNTLRQSLPNPEPTIYAYDPITVHDRTAYLAGQIPKLEGNVMAYTGLVGAAVSLEEAKQAGRICAQQALAWLNHSAGGLENVDRVLQLNCYVAHADGFDQSSDIADVVSGLLMETFGDAGRHSRSVIGARSLPRHSPVLIDLVVALRTPVVSKSP